MIKQKVIVKQPRMKADKTGTVTAATLLELSKEDFEKLNDLSYDSTECTLLIIEDGEYLDFILTEAKRLAHGTETD